MRTASCHIGKVFLKERLPEDDVGEGGERLCEFPAILMPDHDSTVTHEQKAIGVRVDVIIGMAVQPVVMKVLPMVGNMRVLYVRRINRKNHAIEWQFTEYHNHILK